MAFEGVIFDVDGVLVDSPHERAWRDTLQDLMDGDWRDILPMTRYAPERFNTAFYLQRLAGKPRDAGARAALEAFGVPDAATRAIVYGQKKQERVLQLVEAGQFIAFQDAIRFLLSVKALGIPIAAASSSKNANMFLARISVDDLKPDDRPFTPGNEQGPTLLDQFDANVCGRDFAHGKPHPEIFLTAAQELGVRPGGCLVVEDATSGVQAAKAGGMLALGVARLGDEDLLRAAGADLVVPSLDEVSLTALAHGKVERRRAAAA
ncbi:HAD family hydrolase [Polyangium aurulentum]|uniref:HAD family hydrolase n=1 Tax=Polyangium aurulentum TaxID=2567896 RepID=UPI0010ADD6FE|nr:HAD-IA family hydrolase [Polyangium aurulentum]UQA55984.1 HAD-IA family hydrolase [Polyangium aurulentum]